MTMFDVRVPGLKLRVVQADGQDVQPVEVDTFRFGPGETYDVIVEPREDRAYTLHAASIDRRGAARATLAPRPGMSAPVPALGAPPLLGMADMGHPTFGMAGMDHSKMVPWGHGPCLGLRLRYEIVKEFAPFVGVSFEQFTGNTANFAAADGEAISRWRAPVGLKVWF